MRPLGRSGEGNISVAHLTLLARDVVANRRFFQATFGWRPVEHHSNVPTELQPAWPEIAPGRELHLLCLPKYEAPRFEPEYGRHIALFQPQHDLVALKTRLVERGAELIAPQRETKADRFFFGDPSGYLREAIGT